MKQLHSNGIKGGAPVATNKEECSVAQIESVPTMGFVGTVLTVQQGD
jgi:hypothetical protein